MINNHILFSLILFLIVIHSLQSYHAPLKTLSASDYRKSLFDTTGGLFQTNGHGIIKVRAESAPPKYRLGYMPMRNRAEIIRLMLEESGVPYELEVFGFRDWATSVKATTPMGKCPVLRNYDGKGNDLCQEGAITRLLASELGLDGKDSAERAKLDSLYCLWFSTMRNNGLSHDGRCVRANGAQKTLIHTHPTHRPMLIQHEFHWRREFSIESLKGLEGSRRKDRPKYDETFRLNDLDKAGRSLLALDYFEEALTETESDGPYLLGANPSYVDLGLFYILFELAEPSNIPDFADYFDLPMLGRLVEALAHRPQINEYLKSERRMPRYAREETTGLSLYTYIEGKWSLNV
eukprot:CAMPEP_0118637286 /NCGR_PEP_ID=MMETSP0785-20121206/3072_1 /TAXON_ID=91992 /ORGANISM="Bolidomonas pacifica, Strain CCMP 1866" /LENGTH=348 /DNA_ID=CAMNT_0006528463 /DNA_START=404 /DNA_END=1450 /DNA_ORIENTATION=-